jgi:hypothetical protein
MTPTIMTLSLTILGIITHKIFRIRVPTIVTLSILSIMVLSILSIMTLSTVFY